MVFRYALIGLVLAVSGCAAARQHQMREAGQRMDADVMASCKPLQPHVARAACVNEKTETYIRQYAPRDTDLVAILSATRMKLARELDEGRISQEDAQLQLAQVYSEVQQQSLNRDYAAQSAYAQQQGANAATIGAAAAVIGATRPSYGVTCVQTGTITNCN